MGKKIIPCFDVPGRKLGSMVRMNRFYPTYKWGIFWGFLTHLLTKLILTSNRTSRSCGPWFFHKNHVTNASQKPLVAMQVPPHGCSSTSLHLHGVGAAQAVFSGSPGWDGDRWGENIGQLLANSIQFKKKTAMIFFVEKDRPFQQGLTQRGLPGLSI